MQRNAPLNTHHNQRPVHILYLPLGLIDWIPRLLRSIPRHKRIVICATTFLLLYFASWTRGLGSGQQAYNFVHTQCCCCTPLADLLEDMGNSVFVIYS